MSPKLYMEVARPIPRLFFFSYLKSNPLLEPIQEYEKREKRVKGERMMSESDVSYRKTCLFFFFKTFTLKMQTYMYIDR